jgi:hypothetical protein
MAKDNHLDFGVHRFVGRPMINRTPRRSNRYTRAKNTNGTSHEKEARWYERPGRGDDQGFVRPSGMMQQRRRSDPACPGLPAAQTSRSGIGAGGLVLASPLAGRARLSSAWLRRSSPPRSQEFGNGGTEQAHAVHS